MKQLFLNDCDRRMEFSEGLIQWYFKMIQEKVWQNIGEWENSGKLCGYCRTEPPSLTPWYNDWLYRHNKKWIGRSRDLMRGQLEVKILLHVTCFCRAGPRKNSIAPGLNPWGNFNTKCVKCYQIFRNTCCKLQWLICNGTWTNVLPIPMYTLNYYKKTTYNTKGIARDLAPRCAVAHGVDGVPLNS